MRPAIVAGFVLAVLPAAGLAQTGSYLAAVSDPEVLLRAGPSDKFPETGTLTRGTRLVVDHEEAGWLAVEAPPGSVSWVPNAFVDFDPTRPIPQNVATQAEVTLAPGRVGLGEPLQEVRKAKVPEGTILTVIGQMVTFANKKWYPVVPPPGDFRYVPKTAVQFDKAMNTSFVVRDNSPSGAPAGATNAPAGLPPGARPDAAPKPVVNHPLWAQAEEAERAGRYDEAEKLFFQLARAMNEPGGDHDVANLCYTRIHTLREKKRGGERSPASPVAPADRLASSPTGASSSGRDDRPTLLPPVRDPRMGSARPTVSSPASAPSTVSTDNRPRWTGAGTLAKSALALDGRRTYALESAPGVVQLYAVGAQGIDLDRYANRKVDLYGSTYTRKDLSKPYIVVTDIAPNP